jgi:hypothetical protein
VLWAIAALLQQGQPIPAPLHRARDRPARRTCRMAFQVHTPTRKAHMPITFVLVLHTLLALSVVAAFNSAVYHRAVRLLPVWVGLLYATQGLPQ